MRLTRQSRDLLVLTATEPQLRWRTYCATVIELARHLGVQRIITLGALLGDVPHSRPVVVYGSSDDTELARLGLSRSSYEGPTGIVGVLNDACGHEDVPAASLWATVPGYVPGASSPKAALALVERLGEVLDVAVPLGTLLERHRSTSNNSTRSWPTTTRPPPMSPSSSGTTTTSTRRTPMSCPLARTGWWPSSSASCVSRATDFLSDNGGKRPLSLRARRAPRRSRRR